MIKDHLGVRIEKALTPSIVKKLESDIVAYTDRNSEILLSLDLSKRYSFADSDRAVVYNAIGIAEAEFLAEIKMKIAGIASYPCSLQSRQHMGLHIIQ